MYSLLSSHVTLHPFADTANLGYTPCTNLLADFEAVCEPSGINAIDLSYNGSLGLGCSSTCCVPSHIFQYLLQFSHCPSDVKQELLRCIFPEYQLQVPDSVGVGFHQEPSFWNPLRFSSIPIILLQ